MSNPPFSLPTFKVADVSSASLVETRQVVSQLIDFCELSEGEGIPVEGKQRLYYDKDEDRLFLVDSDGLKYPLAYLSDTGNSPILSLTASANVAGDPTTEILVTWTDVGSFDIYQLEFREISEIEFTRIETTSNTFVLDGLTPNTSYDIRVRAIISEVVGPYVTTRSFTLDSSPVLDADIAFVCLGDGATTAAYGVVDDGVEVKRVLVGGSEVVLDASRNITDGLAVVPISQGEAITFTGGLGTATAYDGSGNMFEMTPTTDVAESLFFTRDRSQPHQVFLYAFSDCTATLAIPPNIVIGTTSLTSGVVGSISFTTADGPFKVTNDLNVPMMGFVESAATSSAPTDQSTIVTPGDRLIGIPSAEAWMSTINPSTITVTRSDLNTASFSLGINSYTPTGLGSGSLYAGPSAIATFTDSQGGSVTSVADSNGSKSNPWLRTDMLGTRGWILTITSYVAFASETAGTVNIWNPGLDPQTDSPSISLSLTQTPGAPCTKAYSTNATARIVGSYIESSVPIYAILEQQTTDDEYILFTQ